jgi:hypothetical protein
MFGPHIRAKRHPLPTSPVKGEVPLRGWGSIGQLFRRAALIGQGVGTIRVAGGGFG